MKSEVSAIRKLPGFCHISILAVDENNILNKNKFDLKNLIRHAPRTIRREV